MDILKITLMISNYFHDLATALLASNIAVIYFLGRLLDSGKVKDKVTPEVFKKLSYVTYGAFTYIIIAGIPRAFFFMDFEWNPAVGKGQVAALVVKHIFLVSVTIFGLLMHRKYLKKYGSK